MMYFMLEDQMVFFIQLALALVLGMFLGTERTLAHKTAGLRTYSLVAMGSCLFVIASIGFSMREMGFVETTELMRVIAGIITGVGFIGAGIILFKDNHLTGMTTSAGLWVAAGIGISVGLQLYALAIGATFLTLIIFTIFWFIERKVESIAEKENVRLD